MSDTPNLANKRYPKPPTTDQYRRAARTLARLSAGDIEGLRTALEAIGHPDVTPAPPQRPMPRSRGRTGPLDRCARDLHDMVGANVVVDSSGRRCRECRADTARRRARGQK